MASDRREFLRSIGRDGARTAASLIGAVGAIRKEAGDLAEEFGDPTSLNQPPRRRAAEVALDLSDDAGLVPIGERAPDPAFASPVRDEEGGIVILDVRALPAQILERRAESAAAAAALLAVDAVAPGPIRALVAALALHLADRSGPESARGARLSAAAAALRNAAPLSGSLDAEIAALIGGALPTSDELERAVNAHAATHLAERAAQAERLRAAIGRRGLDSEGLVATGAGLGATTWGDLAPAHEALRRSGRSTLLIAAGPSIAPRGRTRLGSLDASDAVRVGLTPTLVDDLLLAARLARGEVAHLLLGSDLVARDGSAIVPLGGVALAIAARSGGATVTLLAPGENSTTPERPADAAALHVRIERSQRVDRSHGERDSVLARAAAAGVVVEEARVEVLPATLIDTAL